MLADALAAIRSGLRVTSPTLTVGEHLASWLEWQRSRVRPSTWVSHEGHVRLHLRSVAGLSLLRLAPSDVRRLILRLRSEGLSSTTVRSVVITLRMALRQAVDDGLVPRNVARSVELPEPDRTEGRSLTIPQARRLLAHLEGHPLRPLVVVALATGLRQGELLGLRWSDVDLGAGQLAVSSALRPIPPAFRAEGDPRLQRVEPKTDHGYRAVPLPPFAVEALTAHRDALATAPVQSIEDLVFPSTRGTPLDGRNVTRRLQDELRAAGLPVLRFHDLRHTTASLLHAMGVPRDDVTAILGHGSAAMTWRYTHVLPEVWHRATRALEEAIG